jgi:hypothetical protein
MNMAEETMRKASKAFLENYLNNASPTGFETSGQKIWLDYIRFSAPPPLVTPALTPRHLPTPAREWRRR